MKFHGIAKSAPFDFAMSNKNAFFQNLPFHTLHGFRPPPPRIRSSFRVPRSEFRVLLRGLQVLAIVAFYWVFAVLFLSM